MRTVLDSLPMTGLELQLLGTPEMRSQGAVIELGRKPLVMLALLAFGPPEATGQRWTRDALAPLLWPDTPNPLPNLSVALGQMRDAFGPDVVGLDDKKRTIWLETPLTCDALELLEAARSEQPERWARAWTHAPAEPFGFPEPQWDAKFAPDFQDWLSSTRAEFKDAKRDLAAKLGTRALTLGEYKQAVTYLLEVQSEDSDPREAQAILLMLALSAIDQPEQATQVFQRLQDVLRELDGKPSQEAQVAFEIARDQQIAAARALLAERYPQHASGTEMPFVGRDTELTALERQLPRSLEGIGWLTLITGEPGAGKTALARAVIEQLDSRKRIYLHSEGFGERHAPAWRGFDLIARTLVRKRRAVFDAMPSELRAVLARFLPDVLERVTEDPQPGDERLLYAAIRTLLTHDEQPSLLFLDDLQWFDETSLGLVLELLRKPPPRGLLILATFRDTEPPLTSDTQSIWARLLEVIHREKRGQELALPPLDLNAVNTLASELHETANTPWMHAQSGGNPLYLLEMFEANYTQPGRVPPDLEALIRTRIDALPQRSTARDVLEACAILGESTSLNEVKNVVGFDYDTTVQALGALRDARLLQRAESRIQLNHNLTRDATLERMSLERAQLLHLRAARVRQERPELAAMHYWQAMREGVEKLEAEEMGLAVQAFTETGFNQALRSNAKEGFTWLERGITHAPAKAEKVNALMRRARVFEYLAQYSKALQDLEVAESLIYSQEKMLKAKIIVFRATLLAIGFRDAESASFNALQGLEILAKFDGTEASLTRSDADNALGISFWIQNKLPEAEEKFLKSLKIRQLIGNSEQIGSSFHNLGLVNSLMGNKAAEEYFYLALDSWRKFGNIAGEARTLFEFGVYYCRIGDYKKSIDFLGRSIRSSKVIDKVIVLVDACNSLGIVHFFLENYKKSLSMYKYSLFLTKIQKDATQISLALMNIAEIQIYLNDLNGAKSNIRNSLRNLKNMKNWHLKAVNFWLLGEVLCMQKNYKIAINAYKKSLNFAKLCNLVEFEIKNSARLTILENSTKYIDPQTDIESRLVKASLYAISGEYVLSAKEAQKLTSKFEKARVLQGISYISGIQSYEDDAQEIFEDIRS